MQPIHLSQKIKKCWEIKILGDIWENMLLTIILIKYEQCAQYQN